jgi:hypothetical protein
MVQSSSEKSANCCLKTNFANLDQPDKKSRAVKPLLYSALLILTILLVGSVWRLARAGFATRVGTQEACFAVIVSATQFALLEPVREQTRSNDCKNSQIVHCLKIATKRNDTMGMMDLI